LRTDLARLDRLHAEEEGGDRSAGLSGAQKGRKATAFVTQCAVKTHAHGVDGDIHHLFRCRHQATCLVVKHGWCHGCHHAHIGAVRIATRIAEAFLIPRLRRSLRVGFDPCFCGWDQLFRRIHQLFHQSGFQRLFLTQLFAFGQQRQSRFQTQLGRETDNTPSTRQQTKGCFRQADNSLW